MLYEKYQDSPLFQMTYTICDMCIPRGILLFSMQCFVDLFVFLSPYLCFAMMLPISFRQIRSECPFSVSRLLYGICTNFVLVFHNPFQSTRPQITKYVQVQQTCNQITDYWYVQVFSQFCLEYMYKLLDYIQLQIPRILTTRFSHPRSYTIS